MDASLGIGAGANVVGGAIQAFAAAQARKAMAHAYRTEMQRQEGFRNKAFGVFQPALVSRGVEQARTDIAQGAQHREQNYEQAAAPSFSAAGPSASARDMANYDLTGHLRAQLGGYSDWALENMIRGIRSQDELNKISNFAGGVAQVYPYRAYDAQHSQDSLAALGNMISSIGGSAQGWSQLYGTGPQAQGPSYTTNPYGINQGWDSINNPDVANLA